MKNYKTPPECVLEEKFESVIKSVLRPMTHQVQKPLEVVLDTASRRSQNRMPLIRWEAIREYVLRLGIEMQLYTPEDEIKAWAMIEEIRQKY